jgi:hypothetical protein
MARMVERRSVNVSSRPRSFEILGKSSEVDRTDLKQCDQQFRDSTKSLASFRASEIFSMTLAIQLSLCGLKTWEIMKPRAENSVFHEQLLNNVLFGALSFFNLPSAAFFR